MIGAALRASRNGVLLLDRQRRRIAEKRRIEMNYQILCFHGNLSTTVVLIALLCYIPFVNRRNIDGSTKR